MGKDEGRAARQYVDLILRNSDKWAVWDPPLGQPQVGDYGVIDKNTGAFEPLGSIFRMDELAPLVAEATHEQEDVLFITSSNANKVAFDPSAHISMPSAQFRVQERWEFGGKSGAVLAVYQPRLSSLQSLERGDLARVIAHASLKNMSLVTNVTKCSSYAYYLATKESEGFSLALSAQVATPSAPASAGAECPLAWSSSYCGGLYRAANSFSECFTVLYTLKKCKKRTLRFPRGDGEVASADDDDNDDDGEDCLPDDLESAVPPWDDLQSDGEDDPIPSSTNQYFPDEV